MELKDKWDNTKKYAEGRVHNEEEVLRSIKWKLNLDILPKEVSKWMDIYEKQYLEYERLKRELIVIPQAKYSGKTKSYNPLAPEKDNPWTQYFNDQELRKLILLDVSRTFPEKDFFREDKIHEIMTEILFLYCKQKSKLSYRQGMHELLAPILYVVSMDSIHTNHSTNDKDDLKLLDSSYLPSQSYFLFIKLMSGAASFYELPEPDEANRLARAHKARNLLNQKKNNQKDGINKNERIKLLNYPPVTNNPILKTCYRAYYDILKETNPVLYQHFEKLEIEPQLFGLRWFRLLFSREFTFDETLLLWDSIFEYSKIIDDKLDLSYVTFVAAVMLFYIHDEVIDQDYSITLHKLMRFPKVKDIKIIIELAKVLSNNIDSANGYKVLKRIYEFKNIHLALLPMFPNTVHPIQPVNLSPTITKKKDIKATSNQEISKKETTLTSSKSEEVIAKKQTELEPELISEPKSLTEIITSDQLLILQLKSNLKAIKEVNRTANEKDKAKLDEVVLNLRKNIIFIKNRMIYLSNQPEYLLKENWTFVEEDFTKKDKMNLIDKDDNVEQIESKGAKEETISVDEIKGKEKGNLGNIESKKDEELSVKEKNSSKKDQEINESIIDSQVKGISDMGVNQSKKSGFKEVLENKGSKKHIDKQTILITKDSNVKNSNLEVRDEVKDNEVDKLSSNIDSKTQKANKPNTEDKNRGDINKLIDSQEEENSGAPKEPIKPQENKDKATSIEFVKPQESEASPKSAKEKKEETNTSKESVKSEGKNIMPKVEKGKKENVKETKSSTIKGKEIANAEPQTSPAGKKGIMPKNLDINAGKRDINQNKGEVKLKSKEVRKKYDFLFGSEVDSSNQRNVELKPKKSLSPQELLSSLKNGKEQQRESKINHISTIQTPIETPIKLDDSLVDLGVGFKFENGLTDDQTNKEKEIGSDQNFNLGLETFNNKSSNQDFKLNSETFDSKPTVNSIVIPKDVFDNPW